MRSWLYVPADKPSMLMNAGLYGADGIIFDLEDSIGEEEKVQARILLAEAVRNYEFKSMNSAPSVLSARVNSISTSYWRQDLKLLIQAGITQVRLPKVERKNELLEFSLFVEQLEQESGVKGGTVRFQVILETPEGVENAYKIVEACPRVSGLVFGAEDFCSATGIDRNGPAFALDYARSRIVTAASAAGLPAWDTVWAKYDDPEGLREDAERARVLGFTGKSAIHPSQIKIINEVFSPRQSEIEWARRIVELSQSETGAFSCNGMMVDKPVIARAERILRNGDSDA